MTPNEITRRGWFLRLGGAAALSQFSAADAAAAPPEKLPPGLYEPSLQHLAHSLKAATVPLPELLSQRYFGAEDFSLLKKIVALILGEEASMPAVLEIAAWIDTIVGRSEEVRTAARSLSPAHRRLAIDYYGDDAVRELESDSPQSLCREGLAALKRAGFEALDGKTQIELLVSLENTNDPFITWVKRRTLDGFYTSRQGLEELDYKGNAFYAQSPGCDHENLNK
jgi:hypothetical protein